MSSTARLTIFVKRCCAIISPTQYNTAMSKQQTLPFIGGGWISSQEDSPANRSASQASAKELTITATYGRRCCEQFERLPLVGSWAKMFSASLIGRREWFSSRCALIWRMQATRCNRILFRLVPSMRRTAEIACGSSPIVGMMPTMVTQGLKYCNEKGQSAFVPLWMLPTPSATCGERGGQIVAGKQKTRPSGVTFSSNLNDLAKSGLLPTPNAIEGEKGPKKYNPKSQNGKGLTARAMNGMLPGEYHVGESSQLNPLFVAEMMGFPHAWTVLPFLGGDEKASKPTAMQ